MIYCSMQSLEYYYCICICPKQEVHSSQSTLRSSQPVHAVKGQHSCSHHMCDKSAA